MKPFVSFVLLACLLVSGGTLSPEHASAEMQGALQDVIAKQAKISPDQANQQIRQVFVAIESELRAGRQVAIDNFGRFSVSQRKAAQKKAR